MAFQSRGYTSVQDVNITFQTKYIVENAGSTCLAVSGSAPELGRWNVAECLLARETRVGSGNWSVTATMRPTENFFWKWLLVTPDRQKVIRWEDIDHREEFTGTEDREIFAGWNEEAVDVPRTTSSSTSLVAVLIHTVSNALTSNVLYYHTMPLCTII